MALIQRPEQPSVKKQLRIRVTKETLDEIEAYCKWVEIDLDHFFEQSALRILEKDKEWKEYKNPTLKNKREATTDSLESNKAI